MQLDCRAAPRLAMTVQSYMVIASEAKQSSSTNRETAPEKALPVASALAPNSPGPFAASEGRTAVFITERAVFRTVDGALELIEIAPGIDLEKDVLAHMGFRPRIAADLKRMDKRLFAQGSMNLRSDLDAGAAARAEPRLRRAG